MPLPEPVATDLAVIDAALAGESVDPQFAELAELALLLADARPPMPSDVAQRLDVRVSGLASAPRRRRVARAWIFRPAFGAGLAGVAALAIVVVVIAGRGAGGGSSSSAVVSPQAKVVSGLAALPAGTTSSASASSSAGARSSAVGTSGQSLRAAAPQTVTADSLTTPTLTSAATHSSAALGAYSPSLGNLVSTPQSNGRRIVQSAQLGLTAPGARIPVVAQELFSVVGSEAGIVKHSSVTSGSGGYASFTLSIPTANLTATLTRLTQLRYAHVSSSTESSTDVNSRYLDDARALKDAQALRTSLLKQLAAASTTADIDSLKAQIQDAEATIAADEAKVNTLNGQISYTSVDVEINAGAALPGPPTRSGHGFTISRAAHDALRVLTDVGGGALIALAVLVPLALLAGLVTWITLGWRRRGRERALDGA